MNYERVRELFALCLDRPASERQTLLANESEDLRREVESLLAADSNAGGFLAGRRDDRRLGAFELKAKLGEGGMGTVWEAHRADGQFEQRVAIKVIREHFDSQANVDRFRAERQVLAKLSHPNICRLLDGGTTPGGLPYFVMELVEGVRIDEYCRGRSLDERLALLAPICAAVDYAHSQGVLHRDLKPANILVTASGEPKLVDFGIAKLMDSPGEATVTANRMATPTFASPEQLTGGPVDARSDVYSLGATLYRILAGAPPFHGLSGSLPEIVERVTTTEPLKPSEAARTAGETWRPLQGDLDNIVGKAMRKRPEERYASAGELAADLDRHRRGMPVTARAPGPAYRLVRLLQRRKREAWIAAAAFALGIGLWSGWSRIDQRRYGNRTVAVEPVSNRTGNASLDWMGAGVAGTLSASLAQSGAFQVVRPGARADLLVEGALSGSGPLRLEVTARDGGSGRGVFAGSYEADAREAVFVLADRAAAELVSRLTTETPKPPDSRSALTRNPEALRAYQAGREHFGAFRVGPALASFRKSVELDPEFVLAHSAIAQVTGFFNRPAARGATHRAAALAVTRRLPKSEMALLQGLQVYHDGRLDEAAAMFSAASRESPGDDAPLLWLGMAQSYSWRPAEAQTAFARVVEVNPRSALGWLMLAESAGQTGDHAAAAHAADRYCALIGGNAANCHGLRGDLFAQRERWEEAIAAYRRIDTANPESVTKPGVLLWLRGDVDGARREFEKLASRDAVARFGLGNVAAFAGDAEAAAAHFEQSAKLYRSPAFAGEQLLKAAEIYLDRREPARVLALAARHDLPGTPGLRAAAYAVLGNEASAEAEFAALRIRLGPIVGEYMAEQTERFHRFLAAHYRGDHARAAAIGDALPRRFWPLSGAAMARSLAALGRGEEARRYAEFVWRSRLYIGAPEVFEQTSGWRLRMVRPLVAGVQ